MKARWSIYRSIHCLLPKAMLILLLPAGATEPARAQTNTGADPSPGRAPAGTSDYDLRIGRAFDLGVSRDPAGQIRALLSQANVGDPAAQTSMGYLYFLGTGVPRDEEQAFKWFQRAAAENYAPAEYDLAILMLKDGAHHDESSAARWLMQAAPQGLAPAQVNLGMLYAYGIGLERDDAQAVHWFREAAKHRFAAAQFLLGLLYESGQRIKKDPAQAAHWYTKAAEQGYAQAQNNLAGLYRDGAGVPRDMGQAIKWYLRAAEQGESVSYSNLAHLYSDGQGIEPNYSEAYRWALAALRSPSPYRPSSVSEEYAASLRSRLSAEEQVRIAAQADEWMKEHPARSGEWELLPMRAEASGRR